MTDDKYDNFRQTAKLALFYLIKWFQANQLVLNIEKNKYCQIYTYKFIACSIGYGI
jgi:hypothetical protein